MGAAGMFNSLSGVSVGCWEPSLFHIPILDWTQQNKSLLQHPDWCITAYTSRVEKLGYSSRCTVHDALFLLLGSSAFVW